MKIALPRPRRSKHVWFQEEGSWVALAGTDDKEFPSGTELVKSKGMDFKQHHLRLTSSGKRPKENKEIYIYISSKKMNCWLEGTPSTFLSLWTLKAPIPEILVFSRWFPPAELPPRQNISSDLVALALVVSSTHGFKQAEAQAEKSQSYSDFTPQNTSHIQTTGLVWTRRTDNGFQGDHQWQTRNTPFWAWQRV